MSKKPWRNPANPGYSKPAVDTSTATAQAPAAGVRIPKAETVPTPPPVASAQPAAAACPVDERLQGFKSDLCDKDAIIMLDGVSKLLFSLVSRALDALNLVDHRVLAKVLRDEPEPEPHYGTPQKRPRGSAHPLMLLFKYSIAAGNLVPKILKLTHSHLFGKSDSPVAKTLAATQRMVAAMQGVLQGKPPGEPAAATA